MERGELPHSWVYEGTLPVDLNLDIDVAGHEITISDESCDDVTGVRYEVVLQDRSQVAFTVEQRQRGKRQTN
jgi:ribosomal protein S12